jgi:hypothetical protein
LINLFKERKLAEEDEIRRVISDIYRWIFDESNLSRDARELLPVLSCPDCISGRNIKAKLKNKNVKKSPQDILQILWELDYYLLLESEGEGKEKGYKAKPLFCLYSRIQEKFPDQQKDAKSGDNNRYDILDIPEVHPAGLKKLDTEIDHVSEELKMPEFYRATVKNAEETLEHVPEETKIRESLWNKLKGWGESFQYFPEMHTKEELYIAIIENLAILRTGLSNRPDEYLKHSFARISDAIIAIERYSSFEYHTEISNMIQEIGLIRIYSRWYVETDYSNSKKDGLDLSRIPQELRTLELCLAALTEDKGEVDYVPEELKTLEFYIVASLLNLYLYKFIPEKFRKAKALIYHLYRVSKFNTVISKKDFSVIIDDHIMFK